MFLGLGTSYVKDSVNSCFGNVCIKVSFLCGEPHVLRMPLTDDLVKEIRFPLRNDIVEQNKQGFP